MDANQLLCYMRGVVEFVEYPNQDQWARFRAEILRAQETKCGCGSKPPLVLSGKPGELPPVKLS